jgi:hypothetical protein
VERTLHVKPFYYTVLKNHTLPKELATWGTTKDSSDFLN